RSPRAEAEHETAAQDRSVAVAREEHLGPCDVIGPDVKEASEVLDERSSALVAQVVAEIRTDGGAGEPEEDDKNDAVLPGCSPGGRGQQRGFSREGNPGALDQDAKSGDGVTERVHHGHPVDVQGLHILASPWAST